MKNIWVAGIYLIYRSQFVNFSDRKSTRLNSSHSQISYAVFCLKKKIRKHTYNYWNPKSILQSKSLYKLYFYHITISAESPFQVIYQSYTLCQLCLQTTVIFLS